MGASGRPGIHSWRSGLPDWRWFPAGQWDRTLPHLLKSGVDLYILFREIFIWSFCVFEASMASHTSDPDGGTQSRFLLSASGATMDYRELSWLCPAAAEIWQDFSERITPHLSESWALCQLLWSLQSLNSTRWRALCLMCWFTSMKQ